MNRLFVGCGLSPHYPTSTELAHSRNLDRQHVMAIDLGINNIATCVTNRGESFIINGRRLKARAQWFNTQYFRLKEIAEKDNEQKCIKQGTLTKQMKQLRNINRKFGEYRRFKQSTMTKQMRHLWKIFHFQINDEGDSRRIN